MDQNQDRRRGQFHRGRRGQDRRGLERRTPPPQAQEHAGRDHVDVEQIMRDVRARIAQRHGIDLSSQQIQELAARRLESILDPRTIKPALLDQIRKAAAAPAERGPEPVPEPAYGFDDTTLYESHRGLIRFFRRLLNPLLMLLFNPAPIAKALNAQAGLNVEAAQREAERERRQSEWNALHYEILQRLVTEVSRVSIEQQAMSTRVESLSTKVDFNERRVRGIEGNVHQARPSGRPAEAQVAASVPASEPAPQAVEPAAVETGPPGSPQGDSARRRRRRRRGRRGGAGPGDMTAGTPAGAPSEPRAEETGFTAHGTADDPPPPQSDLQSGPQSDPQPEARQDASASEPASPPTQAWEPPPPPTRE